MSSGDLTWFQPALDLLRALPTGTDPRLRTFLARDTEIYVGRAPGRLDVMGGIADYSGGLVLQLPLACATFAICQRQAEPRCEVATRRGGEWQWFGMEVPLASPAALAAWFARHGEERWAGYVIGVVQYCMERATEEGRKAPPGLKLLVDSSVPAGRGVASSAALEVAVGAAAAAACGIQVSGPELAEACQKVENVVVGAPCGIMDQMTAACGRRDRLLRLRCQPGIVEGHVAIPPGYRVYGVDSGISHAVSGADYGTVRTAAFMGYRMIAAAAGLRAEADGTRVRVSDPRWGGYLANLTAAEFSSLSGELPEEMSGGEFLRKYQGITDTATQVRPERQYPVRQAAEHPVRERERVERFARLLGELGERPQAAEELGSLMYAAHRSYGACGLGSDGTDRLVELARAAGPAQGVFGAKITGGGSGGTVAVLATRAAEPVVRELAARYWEETGRGAGVFTDSGPGAMETGVLRLAPGDWGGEETVPCS
jgi:L-arabinokinase